MPSKHLEYDAVRVPDFLEGSLWSASGISKVAGGYMPVEQTGVESTPTEYVMGFTAGLLAWMRLLGPLGPRTDGQGNG